MQNEKQLRPFVKWVGGKRGIINELISRLPYTFNNYYEPFVGGGALLFELQSSKSFISDINSELISSYKALKEDYKQVLTLLDEHHRNHSEEYFYFIRSKDDSKTIFDIAARFIYLNKSCFNGLYRVNSHGKFNSSFGKKEKDKLTLYELNNIQNISSFLQNVDIKLQSFDKIKPESGDFVFFDPPYDDTYTGYTDARFNKKDQEILKNLVDELTKRNVLVMITNSNTDFIRKIYSDYNIDSISSNTTINRSKGVEVIITNYTY